MKFIRLEEYWCKGPISRLIKKMSMFLKKKKNFNFLMLTLLKEKKMCTFTPFQWVEGGFSKKNFFSAGTDII